MGGVRDGYSNFAFFVAIAPGSTVGLAANGWTIDRQGYETVTFLHACQLDTSGTVSGAFAGSLLSGQFLRMQHGKSNAAGTINWANCQASNMLFDITLSGTYSGVSNTSWGMMAGMDGTSCGSGPDQGTFFIYGISNSFCSYIESHCWAVGYIGDRRWVRINLSHSAAAEASTMGFAAFAILGKEAVWPVNMVKRSGPPATE